MEIDVTMLDIANQESEAIDTDDIMLSKADRKKLQVINDKEKEAMQIDDEVLAILNEETEIKAGKEYELIRNFYLDDAEDISPYNDKIVKALKDAGHVRGGKVFIPKGTKVVGFNDEYFEIPEFNASLHYYLLGGRSGEFPSVIKAVESAKSEAVEFEWEEYMDGTKGGFMKKLAAAFNEADMKNLEKLANAFPEVYEIYAKFRGDVLKRFIQRLTERDLKKDKTYKTLNTMTYGSYNEFEQMFPEDAKVLYNYVNAEGEIEFPVGTLFTVTDTYPHMVIEIDGVSLDVAFEDTDEFEAV